MSIENVQQNATSDRSRDKLRVFERLAADLAGLSRCRRRQVGCCLVPRDFTEVLAVGYNGPPAGVDNDSCRGDEGQCGCVHSEASALVKLKSPRRDLILVTTLAPCEHCAGLILNSKSVSVVVYRDEYRDSSGLSLLRSSGLVIVRSSP